MVKLCKDQSESRRQLIRLLLDSQKGGLHHFEYSLPKYHCASRVLLWLAMAGKLEDSENLCLAMAITDGIFLIIGDKRVKRALKKDTVDMVTFYVETEEIQKRVGHKPLRSYPPAALLMLAWRGGSLSSHSFDNKLKPDNFVKNIRKRPLTLTDYRIHVLTAGKLHAMQKAILGKGKESQRRMVFKGYSYYSKKHWDFVTDDKPRRVRIGAHTIPVPWARSAALIFERRQKTGKGIGNCSDQDDARQALWKSIGVPSMSVKMVQLRKGARGKFWGHIISVFYDAERKAWCGVNTGQKTYPYVWALSVASVRYRSYLTPRSDFPRVGSRNYGYEIISGQGKTGGRNEALTRGIPETIVENAILKGKIRALGAYLVK